MVVRSRHLTQDNTASQSDSHHSSAQCRHLKVFMLYRLGFGGYKVHRAKRVAKSMGIMGRVQRVYRV